MTPAPAGRGRVHQASVLVVLLALGAMAGATVADEWQPYPRSGGCIGGVRCDPNPLRVPLDRRPVEQVRFRAHDDIGRWTDGRLRIRIDDTVLEPGLELDSVSRIYRVEGRGLSGRNLVFEAVSDDEVVVDDIEVLYADAATAPSTGDRRDDRWEASADGWIRFRERDVCVGGDLCRRPRFEIPLTGERLESIRFSAHDNVGDKRRGQLRVWLDNTLLARRIDAKRQVRRYTYDAEGQAARYLVFEALKEDEVIVGDIEVKYLFRSRVPGEPLSWAGEPSRGRAPPYDGTYREPRRRGVYDGPGICLGGDLCGQRRRVEIALDPEEVRGVRFHAHTGLGDRRGALRVSIDGEVLEKELEIPAAGRFFTLPVESVRGRSLIFDALYDGEVVVEGIEVRYSGSWVRHRVEK